VKTTVLVAMGRSPGDPALKKECRSGGQVVL